MTRSFFVNLKKNLLTTFYFTITRQVFYCVLLSFFGPVWVIPFIGRQRMKVRINTTLYFFGQFGWNKT